MALPYVLKNKRTTLERAEKFISDIYFTNCNLYGRQYIKTAQLKSFKHFKAPGRISYEEAVKGKFTDSAVGKSFGPTWSTHWFRVEIEIPSDWVGDEVRFQWDSGSEALVWIDGCPIQGFTNENRRFDYVVTKKAEKSALHHVFYVEMSCNDLFGAGDGSQIAPPKLDKFWTLSKAHITVRDNEAHSLMLDFKILIDLVKHLPEGCNRSYQALYTVNEMVNLVDVDDRSTFAKASKIARNFFSEKNSETQHKVMAIGNCHIDSAWLWPYAETIRKCARSFSTTIGIMEDFPDYTFACSQAQQFEWMKDGYPKLYEKMKKYIAEGRFIPVGGTWVEMDGNIPSGEGFMRQFLYGQRYFQKEFGITCAEFWLPDTFGYSAQLPQIMRQAEITRFVTQKISWNLVNKFPHHTFNWVGIDGSEVLTHFPPGDSYGMECKVEELVRTVNNFQDKGRSNHSLYLYGWGDGGQGPSPEMLETLEKIKDCDGLPKVELSTPNQYFMQIEEHESANLCTWTGELYLELHNGTYTTQAKTKQYNRSTELLLRDVEIASVFAMLNDSNFEYPSDELLRVWKLVLLNQFHDVLPGSSINEVYVDAMVYYRDVTESGEKLFSSAARSLFKAETGASSGWPALINTLGWPRRELISLPGDDGSPAKKRSRSDTERQTDKDGNILVFVEAPSFGFAPMVAIDNFKPVKVTEGENITIENEHLKVELDSMGRITGLYKPGIEKNAIAPGKLGNQLVIFDDVPLYWDAWDVMDYHLETRKPIQKMIKKATVLETGPLRAVVEVSLKISEKSSIKQHIIVETGCPYVKFKTEVEWHESHQFLKVEFPTNVHSQVATYETQFGHLQRPTHMNTSWDWAKFEVCGHKWADISEYNWGVAVLNDSKYGWSTIGNCIRLSLLRSPKAPDAEADMGTQTFTYAVMPHTGTFQDAGVIQASYQLNVPMRTFATAKQIPVATSFVTVDNPAVVLDTVKQAEDSSDKIVLRFYEAFGGQATVNVKINLPILFVQLCNGLENLIKDDKKIVKFEDGNLSLKLKPFQILSVIAIVDRD